MSNSAKYLAHYNRLMARAVSRLLDSYSESHHIVPRCMGGGNAPENIVRLTAREHYVAHQLLVKIYPRHIGLARAAVFMAKNCTGNRAFAWLRRRKAEAQRGVPISAKARAILIENNRTRVFTPTIRANMAAAQIGKIHSDETRAKWSALRRGKPKSPEHRAKLYAVCIKMGVGNRGHKRKLGTKHSFETKMKISLAKKSLNPSPNALAVRKYRAKKIAAACTLSEPMAAAAKLIGAHSNG